MRILLLSDSHGSTNRIDDVLARCGPLDYIIFCGDMDDDADYIGYTAPPGVALAAVCGNNDYFSNRPYSAVAEIDGLRFFITHGHREHVKSGTDALLRAAKSAGCQVALYGHTHRAADTTADGIRMINPGALHGHFASYVLLQTEPGALTSVEFMKI